MTWDLENQREWQQKNRDKVSSYCKKYYVKNLDKINRQQKEYYKKHQDEFKSKRKKWYQDNKEYITYKLKIRRYLSKIKRNAKKPQKLP